MTDGPPRILKINKSPSDALALTNCIIASPRDFHPNSKYLLIDLGDRGNFVFTLKVVDGFPAGELGTTLFHRKFAFLSLAQEVRAFAYNPFAENLNCYIGTITLEVSLFKKGLQLKEAFDTNELQSIFIRNFSQHYFTRGQSLIFDFHGMNLIATVISLDVVNFEALKKGGGQTQQSQEIMRGILMDNSSVAWTKASDSTIMLKGAQTRAPANMLIQPDFKFEDMGIGGLDKEFANIFRRAFASRIFPPHIVEKLGIQHVKGILLYGPPGTGKTLIARQIGKMLNAREPKIVNGPEVLSKFVGESEENVRKLFADAEKEYKQRGEESSLHIIIFDELDAICKQRGSKNDGTGVGDSIVNQLLSKMDGVDQLNNILIIGMTNRKDMIDEALLRPGRLEIHTEIGLPDEKGRLQILKIHTTKMTNNNVLDGDVDLNELANLSKNFSGAEIAGLIKSATSFAFSRHVKVDNMAHVSQDYENMKVNRADFLRALDEVHASFGVSEAEFQTCIQNGIIKFNTNVSRILSDGALFVEQVRNSARTPLVSVLLHGPSGSGKTALAASIAMASEYPLIKLISPEQLVGYSENAKNNYITKVFDDAYKSPLSIIVIDAIERLLDWVPIGPRFSNTVLQTLLVLLKKQPPSNRRLLILGTTSQRHVLEQMDMVDAFNSQIYVSNVTDLSSVDVILKELELFSDAERNQALQSLTRAGLANKLSIGIKKLLMMTEMARQDIDKVEKFINVITDEGQSYA
ncbi:P-loop containing nucleoside triphosphate hydrolase protein [Polychytrium aggregatum]|uniref:P-loop containing nucleoside triphosphate hydrolase protein n=1 Tax=Polychytrium aggregatum TaxID=110093 RepID=UPI0022FDFC70|nr:P-loop containing nucleoside triphosphate hydrolase protein [Polychytrium aggregatum]KAI9203249.1 P-loop containing nucleoside triphosphate hydrolase protein [Polychytrium aggregatum]